MAAAGYRKLLMRASFVPISLDDGTTGIEFLCEQRVLETPHHQSRIDRLSPGRVLAQFATLYAEPNKSNCPVRILSHQEAIDFPLQRRSVP